ncbi:MAG: methyltransferase family protein [Candidatus Thorarchaeota archaeon]
MPIDAVFLLKKIVALVISLLLLNVVLILLFPEVYLASNFSITLLLTNLFLGADIAIRPFMYQEGKRDRYQTRFLLLFLLACPVLIAFPYLEYSFIQSTFLSPVATNVFWIMGTLLILLGGTTLVASRIILGTYGTLKIGIDEDHKLITRGPFHYIRHPIYAGTLILLFGYTVSFSSIISLAIMLLIVIPLGRGRMALEEKLLIQEFGDEYLEYMKRTKRIIPFLY